MTATYPGLGAAATPTVAVGTKMSTIGGAFTGTVIARGVEDGAIVAIVRCQGTLYSVNLQTMVDGDGDKWSVVTPDKTQYINVYDDGTSGFAHESFEDAACYSKYDKTRIGIIKRVVDSDGNVISAIMNPTIPQHRNSVFPEGYNPYAKD